MQNKVTITEVADRCGVSFQTVSRIVNGKGHLHKAATVRKVEQVAREMGYVANRFAKSMRLGKSYSIGIIMDPFQESFTEELFLGAHDELMVRDYLPILLMLNKDEPVEDLVRRLVERRVEGFIIRPNMERFQGIGKVLKTHDRPVVCMDEKLSCGFKTDFVGTNDAHGSALGTQYLLDRGHRCFAGLFLDKPNLVERRHAFENAIQSHPDTVQPYVESRWDFDDPENSVRMIEALLNKTPRPTAIVACGDFMLPQIYQAVHNRGLRIPDDLSVLGFGNTSFSSRVQPLATTLQQDAYEIGRQAAKMLVDRIEDDRQNLSAREIRFDPSLVIRDSIAPAQI